MLLSFLLQHLLCVRRLTECWMLGQLDITAISLSKRKRTQRSLPEVGDRPAGYDASLALQNVLQSKWLLWASPCAATHYMLSLFF